MRETFEVRILRQPTPNSQSRWEVFELAYESGMNVITVLQRIAANPMTVDHHETTPVAFEACCLQELCGSCTMVINGHVRQACTALVDSLLEESREGIELSPTTKFPVLRDLVVDRGLILDTLAHVKAWIHVDGYHDLGPGPRMSSARQEELYSLSGCITCGCCVEACPQVTPRSPYIGPAAISQAIRFNRHPAGEWEAEDRLEILADVGGIADCGNTQNCVKVCPKDIPLTTSIAQAGRDTTLHKMRQWFGR